MRTSGALRHVEHLATLGLDPHIAIPEMLRTLSATSRGIRTRVDWAEANVGREHDDPDAGRTTFRLRIVAPDRAPALISVSRVTPLSERDRQLFRAAVPMLQRALAHAPRGGEDFDDMPELTGVVVCDADGRLISADARALLLVAEMDGRPLTGTDVAPPAPGQRMPSFIVDALRAAGDRSERRVERVSCWGAFRAQAFAQSPDGAAFSHVVVVSKHLPRRVALMRRLERMDLSPRERQVAFHLGNGANAADGAAALGVSVTTWRSYVKRVYLRLDVRDRFDLLMKLNARVTA